MHDVTLKQSEIQYGFYPSLCIFLKGENPQTALERCSQDIIPAEVVISSDYLQRRKPRINSQLVAQQVAQQYATPPPPKKEKKEKVEKDKPDKEKEMSLSSNASKKNSNKKIKPKMELEKGPPSEINSIQSGKAATKTDSLHTSRPKLKNVDRSTAQQLAVTVGNVTVIITDFKEKIRSSSTSSSTVTSSAGSEQQNQSSSGSESTDKGSSRSSTPKGEMSAVNDESF
ncbi:RING1 and YY1-binding protein B [Scyliorhinus canicula]|uniref:RING1 and YY1-binding protein B n=1 Tax=Scyliorhinus canicula TaxID=7830 RepID=UPI0018F41CE7|nr:RING1 and YY1-binding protein B [Scyliorhinus canicula]